MAAKEACPENAQLQQMLDGTLPPDGQTEISIHLESCPECQAEFEDLAKKSKLLPDFQVAADERAESALQRVMEKIAGEGPIAATLCGAPNTEELYLPFLSPSDNPEHLGRLGPYDVVSLIGQGGMGVVLKAHDPRLNRFVAIKVLAPQMAANATARKRFTREAQAAAAVSHDHIVTIHAVDEVNGFPYLVMEYVVGLSLAERIQRTGPLGLKETLRIGMQIASGLAAAHAHGLVHRDIKPGNILLENSVERVKITDFGLARAVNDVQMTQTGQIAGTPEYMSPEQARGQPLDHRSDLFSLGCVMYAMCSGRSPFRAESVLDAIMRVCNDPPRPLREIDAETPEWLVEIIDKLLAKDPSDRFQSAAEVAELLGQHLAHLQQPAVAAPPPRLAMRKPEDPTQPAAPRRSRVWIAAAVALLLIGVLGMTEATGVTQLAATVISIFRPEGTLEIVVDDPSVKVTIDGEEIGIQGAGPQEVRLRLGSHQVQAIKDGKPVHQELVTISRGGRRVVKVGMLPPRPLTGALEAEPPAGPVREIAKETRLFGGHNVSCAVFSPDGHYIVSGSGYLNNDCTVRLWDAATGGEIRRFVGHGEGVGRVPDSAVTSVAFSPDGRYVISGSQDRTARLWDVETGKEIRKFTGHTARIYGVSFSPDGRFIASASNDWSEHQDNTIRLWDVKTGLELKRFEGHASGVSSVRFSPDGRHILSGSHDHRVWLWDVASPKQVRQLIGHATEVLCVAISPNGRFGLSGGVANPVKIAAERVVADRDNCVICLWDLERGELVRRFSGHEGAIQSVAFSPDGRYVVSGSGGQYITNDFIRSSDNTVRVWDAHSGRELCRFTGHRDSVWSVAFSPDGRSVVSAAGDRTIRVWELPEDLVGPSDAAPGSGKSIQPSTALPKEPTEAQPPTVAPVREVTREPRRFSGHSSIVQSVAFSPDGSLIASGAGCDGIDCTIRLWDVASGREIRRWVAHGVQVQSVAFSADGRRLLSGGQDKLMRLWNAETGEEIRKFDCKNGKVFSVVFSLDGRRAVSGSADWTTGDNAIRLWDVETGAELRRFEGHVNGVLAVALSSDGKRILSASQDQTVILWDAESGKLLKRLEGHRTELHAVAISPDGRFGISGGWADHLKAAEQQFVADPENCAVCVWDLQSGQLLRRLTGHDGAIHCVAFSPDGRYALSGSGGQILNSAPPAFRHSRDNTVRLWDVHNGRELCRFAGHPGSVEGVAFSPDGRSVLSCGADSSIRLWEIPKDLLAPQRAAAPSPPSLPGGEAKAPAPVAATAPAKPLAEAKPSPAGSVREVKAENKSPHAKSPAAPNDSRTAVKSAPPGNAAPRADTSPKTKP